MIARFPKRIVEMDGVRFSAALEVKSVVSSALFLQRPRAEPLVQHSLVSLMPFVVSTRASGEDVRGKRGEKRLIQVK
jgi:hypothetical protein